MKKFKDGLKRFNWNYANEFSIECQLPKFVPNAKTKMPFIIS